LKSLLGERIHPWLREKAKGKVHIDWANMGIEAASANRTQTASNTIICQRAVFGPGPSHTTNFFDRFIAAYCWLLLLHEAF
jgi:hypothetical protein